MMAMFPVFVIGMLAGIMISYLYFHYIKTIPSNTRFKLQEETISSLREDIETLEAVNADLRKQLETKRGRKPKHAKEE
jgi:hypothetical protein